MGARREPAGSAQRARLGRQTEIPVGEKHRRDAASKTDQQQRQRRADPGDPAMREQPLIETLVFGDVDPVHRIENVEVERQQAVEKLHRSEEHTSELQSLMRISYAVFCLKKKTTTTTIHTHNNS